MSNELTTTNGYVIPTVNENVMSGMLSNINIYKGRHDAVCAAVLAQVAGRGYKTYKPICFL